MIVFSPHDTLALSLDSSPSSWARRRTGDRTSSCELGQVFDFMVPVS
jgi:hypothetical protein